METLSIPVTLVKNSKEINIEVNNILKYVPDYKGSGSVMYLLEPLQEGFKLVVKESPLELHELIVKEWDLHMPA